jgi:hypothetical protein
MKKFFLKIYYLFGEPPYYTIVEIVGKNLQHAWDHAYLNNYGYLNEFHKLELVEQLNIWKIRLAGEIKQLDFKERGSC